MGVKGLKVAFMHLIHNQATGDNDDSKISNTNDSSHDKNIPHKWIMLFAHTEWLFQKWLESTVHFCTADETK